MYNSFWKQYAIFLLCIDLLYKIPAKYIKVVAIAQENTWNFKEYEYLNKSLVFFLFCFLKKGRLIAPLSDKAAHYVFSKHNVYYSN